MFADHRNPPYRTAGAVFSAILALALGLIVAQFQGAFEPKAPLTLLASRAGLVLDPGSKVTYNGVPIGRVATVSTDGGDPVRALVRLDIDPKYMDLLPANVQTSIAATTVFGNKYVAFTSPEHPS
ncbi:MlaD family protein, partial [Mycolicibacterium sp. CBMA 295]